VGFHGQHLRDHNFACFRPRRCLISPAALLAQALGGLWAAAWAGARRLSPVHAREPRSRPRRAPRPGPSGPVLLAQVESRGSARAVALGLALGLLASSENAAAVAPASYFAWLALRADRRGAGRCDRRGGVVMATAGWLGLVRSRSTSAIPPWIPRTLSASGAAPGSFTAWPVSVPPRRPHARYVIRSPRSSGLWHGARLPA
jgi:hypothetical protein